MKKQEILKKTKNTDNTMKIKVTARKGWKEGVWAIVARRWGYASERKKVTGETKRNKNETKQSKTKQNKTKQDETKARSER